MGAQLDVAAWMKDAEMMVWTDERKNILSGLERLPSQNPALLYERIVNLISSYSSSSVSARVDLALIGHCARELMNGLPEYTGDMSQGGGGRAAEEDAVRNLRRTLLTECDEKMFRVEKKTDVAMLPSSVVCALGPVYFQAKSGELRGKRKESIAVLGYVDEANPAVIPWHNSRSFFQRYVHINRSETQKLPTRDEVLEEFSYVENSISARLGHFFSVKSKLTSVLDNANARTSDGSYTVPADSDIDTALSLISNPGLRFVFFSELNNPEWLSPMKSKGVFRTNAEDKSSVERNPGWPEVFYLKRVANIHPEVVTEIALEAAPSFSPVVREALVQLALVLPIDKASDVVRRITEWATQEYSDSGYYWTSEGIADVIRRFLFSEDKQFACVGNSLYQKIFEPRKSDGYFHEITALVPHFFYAEKMDELEDAFGCISLAGRRGILSHFSYQLLSDLSDGTKSSIVVRSVESEIAQRLESISGEVIFKLVQVIDESLNDSPSSTIEWIRKKGNNPVVVRCALYVMQRAIERALAEGTGVDRGVGSYIHDVLLSDLVLEDEYDPELYPLYAPARKLNIISAEELDSFVLRVSKSRLNKYKEWASNNTNNNQAEGDDVERRARWWTHRMLTLMGAGVLGRESRTIFEALSKEMPQAEYQATHFGSTETLVGPNSPITSEEMVRIGADALLEHLRGWHPSQNDRFQLISHEGQGRALTGAVAKVPGFFVGRMEEVLALRPIYQRAILAGWDRAIDEGHIVPVPNLLLMIRAASKKSESEKWESEGSGFDDDFSYLGLRRQAVRLAGHLLDGTSNVLSVEQMDSLLDSLLDFSESGEPDVDYEATYGGDNEDPLTLSMNTIRPIALLDIAKWINRSKNSDRVSDALSAIEKHLPDRSSFISEAAAIGEGLPHLYESVPEWVHDHYDGIFGTSEANTCQQIVLTTALSLYRPNARLFELLSRAIDRALDNNAAAYSLGFRAVRADALLQIGHWLYYGYATGFVSPDDSVLEKWWSETDARHLGRVLRGLCGELRGSEGDVPEGVVLRIGNLWDYHASHLVERCGGESLAGIEGLMQSGCYAADWWGPRLLTELKVNPHEVSGLSVKNRLIELSKYDSELAVVVLRLIVENDHYPLDVRYHDIGLQLLQEAKRRNGGALSTEAARCMDELGSIGCFDLDERLSQ